MTADYDVAIVGGRVAGASLAARLAGAGARVVVIERAAMPSPPAVPSCPVIYPHTMRELDDLGVAEAEYADPRGVGRSVEIQFRDAFSTTIRLPHVFGRDYLYAVDRARFDHLLFSRLERFPNVTRMSGYAVTGVVRDETKRVVGVEAEAPGGDRAVVRARCVVGADGRYSIVARKCGAKVIEDGGEKTSTAYFADWEGLPGDGAEGDRSFRILATGRGLDVLFMPGPDGRTTICTHERSDRVAVGGDPEAYYTKTIQSQPHAVRWLGGGRRVTALLGMKRIQNRFLEPSGDGWVLVGDAFHHKDPADGQGIYDALLASRLLAEELAAFLAGDKPWDSAMTDYGRRTLAELRSMWRATVERVKRELYSEPPELVARTVVRWILTDTRYQDVFGRYICRAIAPEAWLDPKLPRGAILRGLVGDIRRLAGR